MSCTGFDGKLYFSEDDGSSWTEITLARDVSTTSSADKPEVSDRRSKFKKYCVGMIDLETTVTLTYEQGNAAWDTLRGHYLARTDVLLAVVDGALPPASGNTTEGFKYYANVYSHDFDQPLTDGQTVNLTFAPSTTTTSEPTWYTETTP